MVNDAGKCLLIIFLRAFSRDSVRVLKEERDVENLLWLGRRRFAGCFGFMYDARERDRRVFTYALETIRYLRRSPAKRSCKYNFFLFLRSSADFYSAFDSRSYPKTGVLALLMLNYMNADA